MYSRYGKHCRTKKPTVPPPKEKESVSNESTEDALGEDPVDASTDKIDGVPEAEGSEGSNIEDNASGSAEGSADAGAEGSADVGAEGGANDSAKESSDGSDESGADLGDDAAEGSGDDTDGSDDDEQSEDDDDDNDDEDNEEEVKPSIKVKRVMEYDIKDMYPEMNVLIAKKKREWDFQDPDVIRAIWLESKTNVLSEWKVRNAKITKAKKPTIEFRDNTTNELRIEHLKNKAELKKALEEHNFEMTEIGRDPPVFESIQLATNLTTEMRYKYNRNNPPVPSNFVEHFEKYKKPPFKGITSSASLGCKM